jgi:hypothetical protein
MCKYQVSVQSIVILHIALAANPLNGCYEIDDSIPGCTGYCEVKITTDPLVEGRKGNKVKVLTVSARRCHTSKAQ